jgi:eukaryotic-like serine/threonine-protein kinase
MSSENEESSDRIRLINRVVGGRYEVLEAVGSGPLLTAFRARDRQQNRIIALKTLHTVLATRADFVARLRMGLAETLALNHPSIAHGFDIGEDGEHCGLFYAEEFVRGIDLKERIRRAAPFQLAVATDIAVAIAEGLEFAHGRGLTHGDLCPQNILVGPEGQVKITGFGVAGAGQLLLSEQPQLLNRMASYTAPDLGDISTASADLYSVAIILYEMLIGEPPFRGENPIQVALRHAQEPAPSPRLLNQAVPRALEGIVLKGLSKHPSERYPSASALLADLKTVRDALKFGKPLSWSPMDRDREPEASTVPSLQNTHSAPIVEPILAANIMPSPEEIQPARRSSQPVKTDSVKTDQTLTMPTKNSNHSEPSRRSGGGTGRIWLALNLFLALALIGACALVWTWIKPALTHTNVVTVPQLVGKTLDDAKKIAAEQRFRIKVVDKVFRESEPENQIFRMSEQVSSQVREDKEISVWVSKGPEMAIVPSVTETLLDKAVKDLERVGLRCGKVSYEYNNIEPKGVVMEQDPRADGMERRKKKEPVDLVVSKGPEPEPTPSPEPTPAPIPEPNANNTDTPPISSEENLKTFYFKVPYIIPDDGQMHHIRIEVEDEGGEKHNGHDKTYRAGEKITPEVSGRGTNKKSVKIVLYDNDKLAGEG